MQPPQFETRAAIDRLNQILDLPYREGMQDWAIELADAARLGTFCDLYETGNLNTDEKFALMQLIIASLDDLLNDEVTNDAGLVKRVVHLLTQDFQLHFYTVDYWCLYEEEDPQNVFAATLLLRRVWQDCFQSEYSVFTS